MKIRKLLSLVLLGCITAPMLFACAPAKIPATIDVGNGYELPTTLVGTAAPNMGLPDELCNVSVTAKDSVGRTIPTNTSFSLRFNEPTSTETLKDHIFIYPESTLKIERLSDTEYTVTPENELDPGTVYRLSLGTDGKPHISFAFQTESRFALSSSIPADLAVNVPVNSGIEFDFTSTVKTGTDITDYVTITPEVDFKAQLYPGGKRLAIIPQKNLAKNTEYVVTLKAGFPAANGNTLAEDKVIRFRTSANPASSSSNKSYYLSIAPAAITAKSGDKGVFSFAFSANRGYDAQINAVTAEIFEYRNAGEMIEAIKEFNAKGADLIAEGKPYEYPTAGLSKKFSGKLGFEKNETNRTHYGYLPTLEKGFYLANVTVEIKVGGKTEKETVQMLLQVSDITAYFEGSESSLLIWAAANGIPEEKIEVTAEFFTRHANFSTPNQKESYEKHSTKTDANGIALIDLPEGKNSAIVLLEKKGDKLIIFPSSLTDRAAEPYYSYIFTDRKVYFGDDKINFSGAYIPANGEPAPKKLWLQVNYKGAKYPLTVHDDGSFEGSYVLEGFVGYGITLRIIDEDGKCVISEFVRVTAEDKPVYTASITYDKLFYEKGDAANITVTASFFDGTPASDLKFRVFVNVPGQRKSFDVVTGKDGTATVRWKLPPPDVSNTHPTYVSATAELMGTETSSLYVSSSATYIHSNYYFTSSTEHDENGTSYSEIRLNKVDTTALLSSADLAYPAFPDNTVGAPIEDYVKLTLTKVTYVRRATGVEYDPISKTTHTRYTYDRNETVVKSGELQKTLGGVLRLDHIEGEKNFDGYYYYTVTYDRFTLKVNATSRNVNHYDSYYEGLSLESDKESYSVGETIRYTVAEYPEITDTERKYLVTVLYGDTREHFVTDSSKFEIPYKAEFITGALVNVTVLENGRYTLLSSRPMYDYVANNALNVEIIPEKNEYKPGDTVKVSIRVTDRNGTPATAGTRITLAVVDEACFALGEQNLDILSALYGHRFTPTCNRNDQFSLFFAYNMSYYYTLGDGKYAVAEDAAVETEAALAPGAANGAGEDVRVRQYFADNPVYEIKLSENGTAEFTFTAPDNITEWRLTAAAAYTKDSTNGAILAGNASTGVITTLPFFINAGYLESYIEGDDVTCSARVYGKDVSGSFDTVAAVYNEKGELIKSVSASTKAGEFAYFSFGKLDTGSYVLRITCTAKGAGDAVQYPFSVVKTAVLATVEKLLEAKDVKLIVPAKYPVVMSFVNKEQRDFLDLAYRLAYTGSTRSDAIAASVSAHNLIAAYLGSPNYNANAKTSLNTSYVQNGLISLLPYSSGELKLSALIAACCTDTLTRTTKDTLSASFYSYANGSCTEEELVYSLLGLAACGEPVLTDLEHVASGCDGFSVESKLVLAAAFAVIGDHGAAYSIYSDLRGSLFTVTDNVAYFGTASMSTEERIALTATALLPASVCAREDAAMLKEYLLSHTSRVELYDLNLAFYLANYIPPRSNVSTLKYTVNGETRTEELKAGSYFRITLTKAEYESFEVLEASDLYAYVRYVGSAEEAAGENMRSSELKIEKQIVPAGNGIYLVTVSYSVTSDKNNVQFSITDTIPAGARFLRHGTSSTHSKDSHMWLSNRGQSMNGYLYCYNDSKGLSGLTKRTYTGSFSYYVRTAIPGEYVVEAAFAQNTDSGAYAVSERTTITLK